MLSVVAGVYFLGITVQAGGRIPNVTAIAVSLKQWPMHGESCFSKLYLLKMYLEDEYARIVMEIYHGIKGNFLSVTMTTFSSRAHIYLQLNSIRKERSLTPSC